MTTTPPLPHRPAGSVLDGDPRILIPAARGGRAAGDLALAGLQAGPLRPAAHHPPGRPRPACAGGGAAPHRTRRPPPEPRRGAWWRDPPRRSSSPPMSAGSATTSSTSCCVQLPKPRFAALVEVALARPVLPAGLLLRFEPAPGVDGWTVVACAPRRRLGTLTRHLDAGGRLVDRAWTRAWRPGPARRRGLVAAASGRRRGPGLGDPGQWGPLPGPACLCSRSP